MEENKLKVGDYAPDFSLPDQDGRKFSLRHYVGRNIVLYFYPKDNSPGCSIEASEFSALKDEFRMERADVVGISSDSVESHQKFIKNKHLNITLLSDAGGEVQKQYISRSPLRFMGQAFAGSARATFLVDKDGKISKIWRNVRFLGHAEDVLNELRRLNAGSE